MSYTFSSTPFQYATYSPVANTSINRLSLPPNLYTNEYGQQYYVASTPPPPPPSLVQTFTAVNVHSGGNHSTSSQGGDTSATNSPSPITYMCNRPGQYTPHYQTAYAIQSFTTAANTPSASPLHRQAYFAANSMVNTPPLSSQQQQNIESSNENSNEGSGSCCGSIYYTPIQATQYEQMPSYHSPLVQYQTTHEVQSQSSHSNGNSNKTNFSKDTNNRNSYCCSKQYTRNSEYFEDYSKQQQQDIIESSNNNENSNDSCGSVYYAPSNVEVITQSSHCSPSVQYQTTHGHVRSRAHNDDASKRNSYRYSNQFNRNSEYFEDFSQQQQHTISSNNNENSNVDFTRLPVHVENTQSSYQMPSVNTQTNDGNYYKKNRSKRYTNRYSKQYNRNSEYFEDFSQNQQQHYCESNVYHQQSRRHSQYTSNGTYYNHRQSFVLPSNQIDESEATIDDVSSQMANLTTNEYYCDESNHQSRDNYNSAQLYNDNDECVRALENEQNDDKNNDIDDNDTIDTVGGKLACKTCRGKRMCFCYFLKVGYYKFPSYMDLVDYHYKKWRTNSSRSNSKQRTF